MVKGDLATVRLDPNCLQRAQHVCVPAEATGTHGSDIFSVVHTRGAAADAAAAAAAAAVAADDDAAATHDEESCRGG